MQSHLPKVLTVCKRRAVAVGPRPGAYLSGVAVQPASSLCCSVQSSGRSSSVSRVAVSSTGCRPCKIASTSCGLKKARPTANVASGKCRHAWPTPGAIGRGRWRACLTSSLFAAKLLELCSHCRKSALEDADDLVANLGRRESGPVYESTPTIDLILGADDHLIGIAIHGDEALGLLDLLHQIIDGHRWSWP